ncbi:MAG: type IV pilus modification protein PilV [Arenicellales bacterium]
MRSNSPLKAGQYKGSSLLEVLIAAVILGLGLLGISALQLTSLQAAGNAEYRSRASDFACALAERMRANKPAAGQYLTSALTVDNSDYCRRLPPEICSMGLSNAEAADISICTAEQLARYDLWELRCSSGIRNTLPGGQLVVTNPISGVYQIQINWLTRKLHSAEKEMSDSLSLTVMPGIEQAL